MNDWKLDTLSQFFFAGEEELLTSHEMDIIRLRDRTVFGLCRLILTNDSNNDALFCSFKFLMQTVHALQTL